jgi:hypothetical protein
MMVSKICRLNGFEVLNYSTKLSIGLFSGHFSFLSPYLFSSIVKPQRKFLTANTYINIFFSVNRII